MRVRLVALDTGVIIEYIDRAGVYHELAGIVFSALAAGALKALIPPPVLAETLYVAARVYEASGAPDALERAEKLVRWLSSHPSVTVPRSTELDIEAGKAKHRYKLALTDCYVLASSKLHGAAALFRKREAEIMRVEDELSREYKVLFLEDYADKPGERRT